MSKAPAFLLLSLVLAGCAAAPQARLASDPAFAPARYAWDGAGEDPNQPKPARTSRTAARTGQDKSVAAAQDGIETDQESQVKRSLVICKGCLRPQPAEDSRLARVAD
ncbi:hypothetical protein [Bradyrhizobium iriomotense]|uniref:Uncharacterized protein n=1 Tax=Bradyrhizobium iriomotense TaxID=441950 RepID=A0ABQ6B7P8_9BRAD|nr:hypothetical protein [Bradyrhizobium iriomotense]GLR88067.1 hypothetical protein GCM10007857_47790 [Bradyrhizobium iriomotense]